MNFQACGGAQECCWSQQEMEFHWKWWKFNLIQAEVLCDKERTGNPPPGGSKPPLTEQLYCTLADTESTVNTLQWLRLHCSLRSRRE